jgi:cell division protein DivIC
MEIPMRKKNKLFINLLAIALIIWIVVLIKQQLNISQYKDDIKVLSQKIDIAEKNLQENKQYLEEEKQNANSLEYIEKLARDKLGMYLQNERVYIDSNM